MVISEINKCGTTEDHQLMSVIVNFYRVFVSGVGLVFSRSAITDTTTARPARRLAPARKLPVKSTRPPITSGPIEPPSSPTQKNIPPADPMYFEPTSGSSINVSTRRGNIGVIKRPKKPNAVIKAAPDVVDIANRAIADVKADIATTRPLKCGGTRRGTINTVGIPTIKGIEAAKPATAGGNPPVSRMFGSQPLKP